VENYLLKRKAELQKATQKNSVFAHGYDYISENITKKYAEVVPEMVRRVEILEVLLFSFIEHAANLDSLDKIEQQLDDHPDKVRKYFQ